MKKHDRIATILLAGLLVLATLLALQAFGAPFFLDDDIEMDRVKAFGSVWDIFKTDAFGLVRPTKNLLYLLIMPAGGSAGIIAHGLSAFLYLASIVLLFFWFRLWLRDAVWAVAACALWALAPTLVSSVVWFSCANIMISLLAIIGGLLLWERMRRGLATDSVSVRLLIAAGVVVLYAVAFFSYEGAVVFPLLAAVQDYILRRRPLRSRHTWVYVGLTITVGVLLCLRGSPSAIDNDKIIGVSSPLQLSWLSGWFLLDHIKWWFLPFGHQELMGTFVWGKSLDPGALPLVWLLLVLFAVLMVRIRRGFPLISGGAAWGVAALLPMCNLLPVFSGPYADYYLTLASVGIVLAFTDTLRSLARAVGDTWPEKREMLLPLIPADAARRPESQARSASCFAAQARRNKRVEPPAPSGTLLTLGILISVLAFSRIAAAVTAFDWARVWRNPDLIIVRSVQSRPYAYSAEGLLAHALLMKGDYDAARKFALRALKGSPRYVLALNVLGSVATHDRQYAEAVKYYQRVIGIDPDNIYALLSLAIIYDDNLVDKAGAEKYYRRVLRSQGHPAKYKETAYINLGILLGSRGSYPEAAEILRRGLNQFPESELLKDNLAVTLKRMKTVEGTKEVKQKR